MVYPESEPKDTKYLLKVIVKRQESLYKLSEPSGSPKTTEQNHKNHWSRKFNSVKLSIIDRGSAK